MTLSTTDMRKQYSGNDVTVAFSFPYKFLANGDLTVILRVNSTEVETPQVEGTHYTVAGAGNEAGGTVTMTTAPADGETLSIFRDPDITQDTDYPTNGTFPSDSHETAMDLLTMHAQRDRDLATRGLTLTDGSVDGSGEFNGRSNEIINIEDPTDGSSAATKAYVDTQVAAAAIDADATVPLLRVTVVDGATAGEEYTGTIQGGGTITTYSDNWLYLLDFTGVTASSIDGPTLAIDGLTARIIADSATNGIETGEIDPSVYDKLLTYYDTSVNKFIAIKPVIPNSAILPRHMSAEGVGRMSHEVKLAGIIPDDDTILTLDSSLWEDYPDYDVFKLYFEFETTNLSGTANTDFKLQYYESSALIAGAGTYTYVQNNEGGTAANTSDDHIQIDCGVSCATTHTTYWNGCITFYNSDRSGSENAASVDGGAYEDNTDTTSQYNVYGRRLAADRADGFRIALSNAKFINNSRYWLVAIDEGWGVE